jgi:hypothetical protein
LIVSTLPTAMILPSVIASASAVSGIAMVKILPFK